MDLDYASLEADQKTFAEQGYIRPFTLWEPEEMTAWWKQQRKALLDPANNARKVFDNPANTGRKVFHNPTPIGRHLYIARPSQLITEPATVRRMQALIGPDILCWRTEFFPKNPGDTGTGWHQVETYAIGEATTGMLEA